MEDFIHNSLTAVHQALNAWLDVMDVTETEVPAKFQLLEGAMNGVAVTLQTRRFLHAGFHYMTFAELRETDSQALRAVTFYALPNGTLLWPIFGLDYVGMRGFLAIAALDFPPVDANFWEENTAPFLREIQGLNSELIPRKVPEFARNVFSKIPFLVASKSAKGTSYAADVAVRALEHMENWQVNDLGKSEEINSEIHAEKIREWCTAMAQNKKEAGALEAMFGPVASEYLHTYLFAPV